MTLSNTSSLRVLICSDVHLGYAAHDRIRCDDSFRAFDEVLSLAANHACDMVLHAGDLFHYTRPSNHTMKRAATALQTHHNRVGTKATMTVSPSNDTLMHSACPVLSIHGNHDEPSGLAYTSPLHVLQEARLLYYLDAPQQHQHASHGTTALSIGSLPKRKLRPYLFHKQNTTMALYCFGNVRNEQALHTAFKQGDWTLVPPADPQNTYCILMLHQNAPKHHTRQLAFDVRVLPDYVDLVVWGHEHEPLRAYTVNGNTTTSPQQQQNNNTIVVYQPGSSVRTNLAQSECKPKSIGLLTVHHDKKERKLSRIPLKSSRTLVHHTVVLSESQANTIADESQSNITWQSWLRTALQRVCQQTSSTSSQLRPLVRLICDASSLTPETWDAVRAVYSQRLLSRVAIDYVANPHNLIQFQTPNNTMDSDDDDDTIKKKQDNDDAIENDANDTDAHLERLVDQALQRNGVRFQLLDTHRLHHVFRQHAPSTHEDEFTQSATTTTLKKIQTNLNTIIDDALNLS